MQQSTSGEIQDQAVADGMRTMYLDGLNKCLNGITTLEAAVKLGATKAELVGYTDSGAVSGDTDQVVGYAGVIIS